MVKVFLFSLSVFLMPPGFIIDRNYFYDSNKNFDDDFTENVEISLNND